jgi:hypothetical protein
MLSVVFAEALAVTCDGSDIADWPQFGQNLASIFFLVPQFAQKFIVILLYRPPGRSELRLWLGEVSQRHSLEVLQLLSKWLLIVAQDSYGQATPKAHSQNFLQATPAVQAGEIRRGPALFWQCLVTWIEQATKRYSKSTSDLSCRDVANANLARLI